MESHSHDLTEEIRAVNPGLLSQLYAYEAAFKWSERRSARLLKLLMERGPDWGCLPDPAKSLFIFDTPEQ